VEAHRSPWRVRSGNSAGAGQLLRGAWAYSPEATRAAQSSGERGGL